MSYSFKVFPATIINENGKLKKVPIIKGWRENATKDPAQIQAWIKEFGTQIKMWGIPTGRVNGICAVDIDVKNGNGFESLKQQGLHIPDTFSQTTPSGGRHFIFKYPEGDIHIGNTVQAFGKDIDTRGEGGWIAAYTPDNNLPIADAPEWLKKGARVQPKQDIKVEWEYQQGLAYEVLEDLCRKIEAAPVGESNNTLNLCAFEAGQELLLTNSLKKEEVFARLMQAAIRRGKPSYEATATINSGIEGGLRAGPKFQLLFGEPEKVSAIVVDEFKLSDKRWEIIFGVDKLKRPQFFQDWSNRDIMLLSADGGTGKSTLLLSEAVFMSLGRRFLGQECLTKGGKTLFFLGEDTVEKYQQMMGRMMLQLGLNDDEKHQVINSIDFVRDINLELTLRDRNGSYHINQKALEKTFKVFEKFQFDKIVYDPIASFWGLEAGLNDMAKGVIRFMQSLKDQTNCGVEMVNHIGKSSSQNKDESQFAGRGGTGLPSHSRIVKTLYALTDDEWLQKVGRPYEPDESGLVCHIGKFSDYSPLMKQPNYLSRNGYIFSPVEVAVKTEKEKESDITVKTLSIIDHWVSRKEYPSKGFVIAELQNAGYSKDKALACLTRLQWTGYEGKKIIFVSNPDPTQREMLIKYKEE